MAHEIGAGTLQHNMKLFELMLALEQARGNTLTLHVQEKIQSPMGFLWNLVSMPEPPYRCVRRLLQC